MTPAKETGREEEAGASPTLVSHPLVQVKLARLRNKQTGTAEFRRLMREIAVPLAYEAIRDLPTQAREIETPLASAAGRFFDPGRLALISILRAGNGLLSGVLDLASDAPVGLIGLRRDPKTLEAREYYFNVPEGLAEARVLVLDPMLATGHSAIAALTRLKGAGAQDLRLVCVVAAPEGVRAFTAAHPDVPLFTAAVDERLDANGHIVPGLGDAGDRLFGTRPRS